MVGGLLPPPSGDEDVDELVSVGGIELDKAAVYADVGVGRAGRERGEPEVERPDAMVLRDGQRPERAVEGAAPPRDVQALLEEGGQVHLPSAACGAAWRARARARS